MYKHHLVSINKRFGKLVTLHRTSSRGWRCRCDCGREFTASKTHLLNGQTHCGCQGPIKLYVGRIYRPIRPRSTSAWHDRPDVGVLSSDDGKYCARVFFRGKQFWLGTFKTKARAIAVYRNAKLIINRAKGQRPRPSIDEVGALIGWKPKRPRKPRHTKVGLSTRKVRNDERCLRC